MLLLCPGGNIIINIILLSNQASHLPSLPPSLSPSLCPPLLCLPHTHLLITDAGRRRTGARTLHGLHSRVYVCPSVLAALSLFSPPGQAQKQPSPWDEEKEGGREGATASARFVCPATRSLLSSPGLCGWVGGGGVSGVVGEGGMRRCGLRQKPVSSCESTIRKYRAQSTPPALDTRRRCYGNNA